MWTVENRARYNRDRLRYPSDLTDEEWALIEPLIPPGKTGGGKRRVDLREVVNGLMYVLSTGCQWRAIPKDLPPKSTVYVLRLDQLGRSTHDVLNLVHELDEKGASLRVLEPEVTTAGSMGRMIVTILGVVADMELKLIKDRQRAGIGAPKA